MTRKSSIIDRGFDDVEELSISRDKNGIKEIKGLAYLANVAIKITIKRKDVSIPSCAEELKISSLKTLYSGTISLLDPASCSVMISDAKKMRLQEKGKPLNKKDLYASITYRCNSPNEEEISRILMRQIHTLFCQNEEQLKASIKKMMLPDQLTPKYAVDYYLNDFLRVYYDGSTSKSNNTIRNRIKKALYLLPDIPISKIKPKEATAFLDAGNTVYQARVVASQFLQYLINSGKCYGRNPIILKNEEPSLVSVRKAAFTQMELGSMVYSKMFSLLNRQLSNTNCVIALLASGFSPIEIRKLKWKDLSFHRKLSDYVVISIIRDYSGVSKHDFSRPAIPDSAKYLRKVYHSLVKGRGIDAVNEDWIMPRNMDTSFIAAAVNNTLVQAGYMGNLAVNGRPSNTEPIPISVLRNNYLQMLYNNAGLRDDPDTVSFLSGVMMRGTTFISYESHTDDAALDRLYTILKALSVEKKIQATSGICLTENGAIFRAVPKTNHEVTRISGDITLRPGEKIIIRVSHGLTGVITAATKKV